MPSPCARKIVFDLTKYVCATDPEADGVAAKKVQGRYLWQRLSVALQTGNARAINACADRNHIFNSQQPVILDLFDVPVLSRDLTHV